MYARRCAALLTSSLVDATYAVLVDATHAVLIDATYAVSVDATYGGDIAVWQCVTVCYVPLTACLSCQDTCSSTIQLVSLDAQALVHA